jgi:hypothetical protein
MLEERIFTTISPRARQGNMRRLQSTATSTCTGPLPCQPHGPEDETPDSETAVPGGGWRRQPHLGLPIDVPDSRAVKRSCFGHSPGTALDERRCARSAWATVSAGERGRVVAAPWLQLDDPDRSWGRRTWVSAGRRGSGLGRGGWPRGCVRLSGLHGQRWMRRLGVLRADEAPR